MKDKFREVRIVREPVCEDCGQTRVGKVFEGFHVFDGTCAGCGGRHGLCRACSDWIGPVVFEHYDQREKVFGVCPDAVRTVRALMGAGE